jgi:hypothetical protein
MQVILKLCTSTKEDVGWIEICYNRCDATRQTVFRTPAHVQHSTCIVFDGNHAILALFVCSSRREQQVSAGLKGTAQGKEPSDDSRSYHSIAAV